MKKIITLFCCIAIANTTFTQIKTNRVTSKAYEPARQNIAIMAVTTNRDSLELNQLFEAYKIADADATNKLEKLLAKMKLVNEKNANKQDENTKKQYEIGLNEIYQMLNKRAFMLQYVTNLINSFNSTSKTILENIR
jgi:hypothetical protein